jgi:hypothetical protein
MDALVRNAGGHIGTEVLTSRGIGGGRSVARAQQVSWYVIPDECFESE